MSKFKFFKSAYTLAEVVVVMLVVAVVVSVSIKITKVKLDNIISYTYYSGYSTLRSVCGQILSDFRTNDSEYLEVNNSWFNKLFSNPAYSKTVYTVYTPLIFDYNSEKADSFSTLEEMYNYCSHKEDKCLNMQGYIDTEDMSLKYKKCPGKFNYYKYRINHAAAFVHNRDCYESDFVMLYENINTYDINECNKLCTNYPALEPNAPSNCGQVIAGEKATGYYFTLPFDIYPDGSYHYWNPQIENYSCNRVQGRLIAGTIRPSCSGQHEIDDVFLCNPKSGNIYPPYMIDEEDDEPSNVCTTPSESEQQTHRCQNQEEWNQATCGYVPITCTEGNHWSVNSCGCVPESPTLPRKGINFCKKFVSYTNTKSNSPECTGSSISSTDTDFSDKTADITLRNGMRIYNMSQNPQEIGILEGNTQGSSYDGVPNINTFGYTVYLDIDGEKGSSTLWEDVYKFYITMAGKVIPAYDESKPNEEVGGNSKRHLMTSVEKEAIVDGRRQMRWLKKSVTFKEGACTSNYLGASSRYCNGVNLLPDCNDPINPCFMKHISPVKFF